jgi:hypothetical protein
MKGDAGLMAVCSEEFLMNRSNTDILEVDM